jgi:hypothetical protein
MMKTGSVHAARAAMRMKAMMRYSTQRYRKCNKLVLLLVKMSRLMVRYPLS